LDQRNVGRGQNLSQLETHERKRGLLIASKLRKRIKIGSTVRLDERVGKLEVIPISDPLKKLEGSAKARVTAKKLNELAE
jgi:hypothetical protein